VWQVATGYTGRRNATNSATATGQIVDTAKCANCHNALGNTPNYHAGQRNDAATCAFCHTPNRTSSGWSAGSESFVHGIHSAAFRTVKFNWHATSLTEGFYDTTYPGRLQYCESCHNPGYFDFSNSWYSDANMARRLVQTVATGTFAPGGYVLSPYVATGLNYGAGYTYTAASGAIVDAAPTTLVNSTITNVCFSCHDGLDTELHMQTNGGSIYAARSDVVNSPVVKVEQCLICHGPGKLASIKDIHYK
jgi:OmcA/MtrC family decaheme c-type cytochrome